MFSTSSLTAGGKEQRDKLESIFREHKSAMVLQSEFQAALKLTKWFKASPYKNHPYVNGDCSSTSTNTSTSVTPDPDCGSKYLTIDEAIAIVAGILGWDTTKIIKHTPTIIDIMLNCPNTTDNFAELKAAVIASGFFGPEVATDDIVPERMHRPVLLAGKVFQNPQPERITWAQLRQYFNDYYKWGSFVMKVDEFTFKKQKQLYERLPSKDKATTEAVIDNKILSMTLPYVNFIKKFADKLCNFNCKHPEKNHPFWSTPTGQQWAIDAELAKACAPASTDTTTTVATPPVYADLTWTSIFAALQQIEPCVLSMEQLKSQNHAVAHNTCPADAEEETKTQEQNNDNNNTETNDNNNNVNAGAAAPSAVEELKEIKIQIDAAEVETEKKSSIWKSLEQRYGKLRKGKKPNPAAGVENVDKAMDKVKEESTKLTDILRFTGNEEDAKKVENTVEGTNVIIKDIKEIIAVGGKIVDTVVTEVKQLIHKGDNAETIVPPVIIDPVAAAFLAKVPKPPKFSLQPYKKVYRHQG
jgi:hypothetical protein